MLLCFLPKLHNLIPQTTLTTEMLASPMEGVAPALHTAVLSWHTDIAAMRLEGRVAPFTSDRPLPQAENATSQKKVNEIVTQKSWRGEKRKKDEVTIIFSQQNSSCYWSKIMDIILAYPLPQAKLSWHSNHISGRIHKWYGTITSQMTTQIYKLKRV